MKVADEWRKEKQLKDDPQWWMKEDAVEDSGDVVADIVDRLGYYLPPAACTC